MDAVSVVIPARNAELTIGRCLAALAASEFRPDEVVVVDDGSQDRTGEIAEGFPGVAVLRLEGGGSAAAARNSGVAKVSGSLLVFVDADVEVHPETLGRLVRELKESRLAGIFGAYDDDPACARWASRYKNLAHHFVHCGSEGPSTSFWTGLGILRRSAFDTVGGFDDSGVYDGIEDVELGLRLHAAGLPVALRPSIQAKHLKSWSFSGWVKADFFQRALPWVRMLQRSGSALPGSLNFRWQDRLSVALAWLLLPAVAVALVRPVPWLLLPVFLTAVWLWSNAGFLRLCRARGGLLFAAFAAISHVSHHLAASAPFLFIYLPWKVRQKAGRALGF